MAATAEISIVLPTRNGQRHLDEAVESILSQKLSRWELILVDDASTDQTPQKVAAWSERDPRIRAICLSENRKLPGALNEGFRHATADVLTWTSDDNWYAPEALARLLHVLQDEPDVDVVYSDYTLVDADGTPIGVHRTGPREELVMRNAVGACFVFRRRVFERLNGYDERLFLTEDYDFWLRASLEFSFRPVHEPLYFYRQHERSLTARQQPEISRAAERAVLRWLPKADWLTRKLRGQAYEALGLRALLRGDVRAGRRFLLKACWLLRRPPVFHQCRSFAVDWIFGAQVGNWLRRRLGR